MSPPYHQKTKFCFVKFVPNYDVKKVKKFQRSNVSRFKVI